MTDLYRVFDSGYRGECNLEQGEQISVASWLDYHMPWVIWFHVPNEGKRKRAGVEAKQMGMKSGVSDIIILSHGRLHDNAAIEIKRRDRTKSRVSDDQKIFLNQNAKEGNFAALCYGKEETLRAIRIYFTGSEDNDTFAQYLIEQRRLRNETISTK